MAEVWNDKLFAVIAPEYAPLEQGQIDALFPISQAQCPKGIWKSFTDQGRCNIVAHILKISEMKGIAGSLNSESVGSVSHGYGLPNGVDGEYATTSYGIEFMRIRRTIVAGPTLGWST